MTVRTSSYRPTVAAVGLFLLVLASVPGQVSAQGVTVGDVVPGGAAATWGIEAGDRIVTLAGVRLANAMDLDKALDGKAPGDKVTVELIRDGKVLTLRMVLGEAPSDPARPLLGITMGGSPGAPIPRRPVSADEKAEILGSIATHLRDGYVFADKGEEFAARIERDLAAGKFDEYGQLDEFVGQLTPYLQKMSHDKHLRIRGAGSASPTERQARRMVRGEPEAAGGHGAPAGDGPRRPMVRRGPGSPGAHGGPGSPGNPGTAPGEDGMPGEWGFESYKMLEGNVGYLDLRGFANDPASKAAADEAMMALEGAEAMILDLRMNGGGAPFMVRYLSAFFFPEPTHLASTMMRGMDEPSERWTLHDGLPTKAFVDVPLYILTSGRTFSAAESFTFGLKVNDRITQVGARTGGGGHFGQTVAITDDIELFLPRGRTYDPATGEGWEAEGLEPDIEVPASEALEAALEAIRAG